MPEYRPGMTTLYQTPRRGIWLFLLLAVLIAGGAAAAGYYAARRNRTQDQDTPANGNAGGADEPGHLDTVLIGSEPGMEGVQLLKDGRTDEAIRWFDDYLASGLEKPNADAALFHLGLAWEKKDQLELAVSCYSRLVKDKKGSPWTASALMRMARITANNLEREKIMEALWQQYPGTPEGKKAALIWADVAFLRFCANDPDYSKWEEVRDAYSLAVENMERTDADRKRVVERLRTLNDAIFYDPAILPKGAYWVRVLPGDSISAIASRAGSWTGIIKRLNGLRNDNIRTGDELKVAAVQARIIVDRDAMTLTLYVNGKFFKEYPVGIGRANLTPAGRFFVRDKTENPTWYPRGRPPVPFGHPENILGTRWLGFSGGGRAGGLGIHGTTDPQTIGKKVSNGCIRMHNADVEELYDFVPKGAPVIIR